LSQGLISNVFVKYKWYNNAVKVELKYFVTLSYYSEREQYLIHTFKKIFSPMSTC